MLDDAAPNGATLIGQHEQPPADTAKGLLGKLILLYVAASVVAVIVTFFLVFVGLEFTGRQWVLLFLLTPFVVPVYVLLDIYAIIRNYRPLRPALARLDAGDIPTLEEASPAVVRALNLPLPTGQPGKSPDSR